LMKKIDGHKATAKAESLVDMVEKISGHRCWEGPSFFKLGGNHDTLRDCK
jgi:hypothetical protein